jgi:hypothetical protein
MSFPGNAEFWKVNISWNFLAFGQTKKLGSDIWLWEDV